MNLEITKAAIKFLDGLDGKQYKQVVGTVLSLLKNPLPNDSSNLKGAKNGEKRVDIGEYRIIYTFNNQLVSILIIGKRNGDEVYKKWNQS